METFKKEREFQINEIFFIKINRNDFEEVGSILELDLFYNSKNQDCLVTNNIILISFFDHNQLTVPTPELLLLSNEEYKLVDNFLMIIANYNNHSNHQILKLLNKQIHFVKIVLIHSFIEKKHLSNHLTLNQIKKSQNCVGNLAIDIFKMEKVDEKNLKKQISQLSGEQANERNQQLNLIFEELNSVNLSLINEKEILNKNLNSVTKKEENINKLIQNFKKEIMMYSDKFLNESFDVFNGKVLELHKKMQIIESKTMNKMKVIKEKMCNKLVKENKPETNINYKEKMANLEIKLKLQEESICNMKHKLIEKEAIVKAQIENEEKLNKLLKKIKEENLLLLNKIKLLEGYAEKESKFKENSQINNELKIDKCSISKINSSKTIQTKIKPFKTKSIYDLDKNHISQINEYFTLDTILHSNNYYENDFHFSSFSDKEISYSSIIIVNLIINPINLFNKFPYSIIFLVKKLSMSVTKIKNLKDSLSEFITNFSDLKKKCLFKNEAFKNTSKSIPPIIDLNSYIKDEFYDINYTLIQNMSSFMNYFKKQEKKYLEKNNFSFYKLISVSVAYLKLILVDNYEDIYDTISNDILKEIIFRQDYFNINYLIFNLNYFQVIILNIVEKGEKIFDLFVDSFLFLFSIDSRFCIVRKNKKFCEYLNIDDKVQSLIKKKVEELDQKYIYFGYIISRESNCFIDDFDKYKNITLKQLDNNKN
jgi:hypothetical protein